jgi:hypothetical protein
MAHTSGGIMRQTDHFADTFRYNKNHLTFTVTL